MEVLQKLLDLDTEFLNKDNTSIIDDLDLLEAFYNKRNSLIKEIEGIFASDEYSKDLKTEILSELTISTNLVTSKIRQIKSIMKSQLVKSNRYKNAYQENQFIDGSFFIDKLV